MIDFKAEETDNITTLTIGGELTVQNASALQGIFIRSLESSSSLTITLKDVTDLDLSFLQLLCSVHRTSTDLKKNLTLSGPCPEVFREAVKSAGFLRRTGCAYDCNKNCLWAEMKKHAEKEIN
jgi:anti-anti-sigma regulatory factor